MQKLHPFSAFLGFLAAVAIVAVLGAQPAPSPTFPKYQVVPFGDQALLVVENQSGKASLLFKKRVDGVAAPDWPWACDNTFSLEDALKSPSGAVIHPGSGR